MVPMTRALATDTMQKKPSSVARLSQPPGQISLTRRAGTMAALAVALGFTQSATAQPLLPGAGTPFLDGRLEGTRASPVLPSGEEYGGFGGPGSFGGFRGFGSLFGAGQVAAPPAPARPWRITPSIGVELWATDNVDHTADGRQADLLTTITPSVDVEANSARIRGRFNYSPSLRYYAETRGQNGIDHNFSGQALATLLEDRLFLDLRALGGLQAIGGRYAPQESPITNRRDLAQTVTLQASPYLVHRFGDLAVAQIGYSYQYYNVSGDTTFLPGTAQPFFTGEETSSHQGYAVIRSGQAFGRLGLESRTTGTVYESSGVLEGAHRIFTSLQARYSVTREIAVLAEGGYEDQHYGGTRPLDIQGPIWSVGVRLTPNPDSVIIVRYGRRDGYDSASVNANFYIGGRTRVFATYSDRLGTAEQQAADLLSSVAVDPLGNLVDSTTGAPVLAPFGGSLLATQDSLQRVKRATAGISQIWPRDTVTLFAYYDDRTPVTSEPGTLGFPEKGYSVGLTWSRMLTPVLRGLVLGEYGRTESSSALGDSDTYTFGLGLSQELAPGLFGSVQYNYYNRGDATGSGRAVQNIIILGLRKVF